MKIICNAHLCIHCIEQEESGHWGTCDQETVCVCAALHHKGSIFLNCFDYKINSRITNKEYYHPTLVVVDKKKAQDLTNGQECGSIENGEMKV
jgi:hypothetical protein